jgi:hypothetical protein
LTKEVAEDLASAPRRQQLFLIETDRKRFDTRTVLHVIADGGWKCTGGGRPTIRTLFTDETMLGHGQSQWGQIKDLTANRLFSAPDVIERCTTACAGCRRVTHDAVRCHHLCERRSRMTDLCARLFSTGCAQGTRALTGTIACRRFAAVATIGGELFFQLTDPLGQLCNLLKEPLDQIDDGIGAGVIDRADFIAG